MFNIKINFYDIYEFDTEEFIENFDKDVKYNFELYKKYFQFIPQPEYMFDYTDEEKFFKAITNCKIYYEPLIYDEERILKYDLLPFSYKGKKLIALGYWGIITTSNLDYYALKITKETR